MTYLMVPLDAEGVTVRGVGRLDGDEGFAEVFFDDVFVADDLVLGEVNQGWGVAMATTSSERGLTLRSPGRFCAAADRLVDLWRRRSALAETGDPAAVAAGDPQLRDAVAQSWMDAEAYRLATLVRRHRHRGGALPGRPLQPHQDLLVRAGRAPARDRPAPARDPPPSWPRRPRRGRRRVPG